MTAGLQWLASDAHILQRGEEGGGVCGGGINL